MAGGNDSSLPGGFRKIARTAVTPTEIIGIIRDQPLEFEPGSKNKYANTGYDADGKYRSLTLHQDGAVLNLRRQ